MFFESHSRLLLLGDYYRRNTRRVTACDITRIIRRQFPAADYSFKTGRDTAVDPDMIVVSGLYDSFDDSENLPHTEIFLNYHPDQEYYFLHLIDWTQLSFDIAECIGHELVHRQQYQRRSPGRRYHSCVDDTTKRDDQNYFGDTSEIEAYGFSIAAESMVHSKPYENCSMYKVYQKTFDTDPGILVKLEKEILKYIKQLEHQYEQTNRTRSRS